MLYILDKHEQGKAILSNSNPKALGYYNDTHLEQLDGVLSYEFSTPANHEFASEIVAEGYVLVRDLDNKLIQFKIKRVEETNDNGVNSKKVYAENAAISDLLGEIVRPVNLTAASLEQAATHALRNTGWILGDFDTAAGLNDFDFSNYPTGLAALNQIRDTFELEIAYRVTFDGAKVRERFVDLVERRGDDTGKRFEYGKDLLGVTREEDSTELVTALVGVGKANEDGTRVTFNDIETTSNDYFKPANQDWVGDDEALALYGRNGKHIFGKYEDTNAVAWTTLLDGATKELKKRSKPRMTYTVSVVLLERLTGLEHEKVRLGDRIVVLDTTFNPPLRVEARVIEIVRSYTDPTQDSVVLGEFAPIFVDASTELANLKDFVNLNSGAWDAPSETIYKNALPPTEKKLDMLWLDLSLTPNLLKRWDGVKWVKASANQFDEVSGQIVTTQISNDAVGTAQIAPNAVTTTEIATGAVTGTQIAGNAIAKIHIAPLAIEKIHIAPLSIDTIHINPLAITAVEIADAAILARSIADGAVDALKLKDSAVTTAKIAPLAIEKVHIAPLSIETVHINPLAITAVEIADSAVLARSIANGAVDALKLKDSAVTTAKIAPLAITAPQIANYAIESTKIQDGAIEAIKLRDEAVTSAKLAPNAIKATHIDAGAITEAKMKWSSHLIF